MIEMWKQLCPLVIVLTSRGCGAGQGKMPSQGKNWQQHYFPRPWVKLIIFWRVGWERFDFKGFGWGM